MTGERHPATAEAWKWLESGPGTKRSEVDQARIRLRLAELDQMLWALDRTAPIPADYAESAE